MGGDIPVRGPCLLPGLHWCLVLLPVLGREERMRQPSPLLPPLLPALVRGRWVLLPAPPALLLLLLLPLLALLLLLLPLPALLLLLLPPLLLL